jgi:hypothetical protein
MKRGRVVFEQVIGTGVQLNNGAGAVSNSHERETMWRESIVMSLDMGLVCNKQQADKERT